MTGAEAEKALHGHANKPADQPDYTAVSKAIQAVATAKGRAAAVTVLGKFSVARGPELKPEQYAGVIAACNEALLAG